MNRRILLVASLLTASGACATTYPYWGLGPDSSGELRGTLYGKDPKHDRDLAVECHPTEQDKSPCVVQKNVVYERLLTDLSSCQERLKACERGGQ